MSASPEATEHEHAASGGVISGVSHYGIQVEDLDRSIAFYEDLLGQPPLMRFQKDSEQIGALVRCPGLDVRGAVFRIPGAVGGFLEILDYRNVPREAVDPATENPGTAHICFFVDELDAMYERLSARGIEFLSPPQTPEGGPHAGGRVVYMVDPDGIRIELLEASKWLDDTVRRRDLEALAMPQAATQST